MSRREDSGGQPPPDPSYDAGDESEEFDQETAAETEDSSSVPSSSGSLNANSSSTEGEESRDRSPGPSSSESLDANDDQPTESPASDEGILNITGSEDDDDARSEPNQEGAGLPPTNSDDDPSAEPSALSVWDRGGPSVQKEGELLIAYEGEIFVFDDVSRETCIAVIENLGELVRAGNNAPAAGSMNNAASEAAGVQGSPLSASNPPCANPSSSSVSAAEGPSAGGAHHLNREEDQEDYDGEAAEEPQEPPVAAADSMNDATSEAIRSESPLKRIKLDHEVQGSPLSASYPPYTHHLNLNHEEDEDYDEEEAAEEPQDPPVVDPDRRGDDGADDH